MKVHERIRFFRQLRGWSQEEVADRLGMSVNGYGSIERGETDVNLSRLEQISQVFQVTIPDFFDTGDKNIFNLAGTHNNQSNWFVGSVSTENILLKHELEKQRMINEQNEKEITYLKEIIELLKNGGAPR